MVKKLGLAFYPVIKFMRNMLKNKKIRISLVILFFKNLLSVTLLAQYPWPVQPLHQSQELTATFCEFRNTLSSDHFHNGVDIPKPDGSPVYAVANGRVTSIERAGSNAYVRVERYCYLHIKPSQSLIVGDQVYAEQTIVGTILAGQGHIHFIDGYYDSEINAVRMGGGLTPYEDPWAPKIRYVKFFQDETENEFPGNKLSGKVDIVVKVEEQNGPPGTSQSRLNNGAFILGYRILSANGDTIKYSPPNNGVRFKFTNKPNNRYIHNVFFKKYSSTSSHVYTVTNNIAANSYWDTTRLPTGPYHVMIFTEDTRENTDTLYVPVEVQDQDIVPPSSPILKYIRRSSNGFQIAWYANKEADLAGYRLYYSYDNSKWTLRANESKLPPDSTTATFLTVFSSDIYFKLTAIDNAAVPNESEPSDVYGLKMDKYSVDTPVLIVDGFDRTSETGGAWQNDSQSFGFTYGKSLAENGFAFDCCSNEALLDSTFSLNNYFAVFWFLGDEAEKNETFSAVEQNLITTYVNSAGRLFISGANIAWDLDLDSDCYSTTEQDNDFLNQFLKTNFVGKISPTENIFNLNGWLFEDLEMSFDPQIYMLDSLDVINPILPAEACLWYDSTHVAALTTVNSNDGKLVYFAFPFEIINSNVIRAEVMNRILSFLFVMDSVNEDEKNINTNKAVPEKFILEQNYPNPFINSTVIRFHIPNSTEVNIKIYNLLGQQIRTLENRKFLPGIYDSIWDGKDEMGKEIPNGMYFSVLETDNFRVTKKLLIVRQ
jgi:hypothetical protein